jgi:ubiquinone/menaquinone biosynthesis C-methylase UbiE
MPGTLSHSEAKKFYDRFGLKQDRQFYENKAIDDLIANAGFESARSVFEFGFGTGKLAVTLLRNHLPADARYVGIDISTTMMDIARERLKRFGDRIELRLSYGSIKSGQQSRTIDRFVSTYVLDLLSPEDIKAVLKEAGRILHPGGLLCLAGLSYGKSLLSRVVTPIWSGLYSIKPAITGGCRPIRITEYIDDSSWRIDHHSIMTTLGLASEVFIAAPKL